MNIIHISYEEVIAGHSDLVYRIAITQVKNKEDAEDIFQEVFVSLIKKLDVIEDEAHLKHWLIRATINRSKNHHLCFWKRKVELCEENTISNLENATGDDLLIDQVREEIRALPQKIRSVVYLYYYEEYSVAEIATILEVPVGTVKSRLHTARGILKNKLKEVYQDESKPY